MPARLKRGCEAWDTCESDVKAVPDALILQQLSSSVTSVVPLMTINNHLFLCSPVNAIVEDIYEERIPFSEIKRHGDFGLGTFDMLDGEMVMLDGLVYQMTADGRVEEVGDDALTPFSCVTFYRPEHFIESTIEIDFDGFLRWLQSPLPSPNIFYAFRVDGEFAYMKVRSVPKSQCYIPLVEIAREQPVFEYSNIRGTLAGFYTPDFMASVSVPGIHLHFLSEDLAHGGHLLECRPRQVRAGIQSIYAVELALPTTPHYLNWDFRRDVRQDLEQAEK
jgi:acetolactate decarboxylase